MNEVKVVNIGSEKRASFAVIFKEDEHLKSPIYLSKQTISALVNVTVAAIESKFDDDKMELFLSDQLLLHNNGSDMYDLIVARDMTVKEFLEVANQAFINHQRGINTDVKKEKKVSKTDLKFLKSSFARAVCKMAPPSETDEVTDTMLEKGYETVMDCLKNLEKKELLALSKSIATKGGLDSETKKIRFKKEQVNVD